MYVCMYAYVHACKNVCTYACMFSSMYVFIFMHVWWGAITQDNNKDMQTTLTSQYQWRKIKVTNVFAHLRTYHYSGKHAVTYSKQELTESILALQPHFDSVERVPYTHYGNSAACACNNVAKCHGKWGVALDGHASGGELQSLGHIKMFSDYFRTIDGQKMERTSDTQDMRLFCERLPATINNHSNFFQSQIELKSRNRLLVQQCSYVVCMERTWSLWLGWNLEISGLCLARIPWPIYLFDKRLWYHTLLILSTEQTTKDGNQKSTMSQSDWTPSA